MTKTTSHQKRRRNGRNNSTSSELAIAVLRKDFENVELEGTLLDVSTSGFRLSLAQPLSFLEKIVLKMPKLDGQCDLEAMAEVRWMKNVADNDSWTVGCAFLNDLATNSIDELAIQGVVDRRSTVRESIEQRAIAQWEASEELFPVTVINSSAFGLCIIASGAGEIGRKTRLKIEQTDGSTLELTATAKWLRQFDSGYMIGCEAEEPWDGNSPASTYGGNEVPRSRKRSFSITALFCIFLIAAIFYWSNWIT